MVLRGRQLAAIVNDAKIIAGSKFLHCKHLHIVDNYLVKVATDPHSCSYEQCFKGVEELPKKCFDTRRNIPSAVKIYLWH